VTITTETRPVMTISKLSPNIGAEVIGIDMSQPVPAASMEKLIDALHEHIFLVFRDQDFDTPDKYEAAGALFGELMDQDQHEIYGIEGHPKIRQLSNKLAGYDGRIDLGIPAWHTDHTHFEMPPKYTSMYPLSLPSSGGGTSFANMRIAYDRLPDATKKKVDAMQTVNVLAGSAARGAKAIVKDGMKRGGVQHTAIQPLVRTHPNHGSKALYFQAKKTENIVGMTPEETQDFFEDLLSQIIQPDNSYTHAWRMGDFLIWDNRSALHKAGTDFDHSQSRKFYRLTVKGEKPV
jgi:alpha-ketoglutarate-dependent taurine dioxygenase